MFILFSTVCPISSSFATLQVPEKTTILLSKGEHKELPFKAMTKYSITNKDTLSHKLKSKTDTLLIKGHKIGYSEIILWGPKKYKRVYRVYVLEKRRQLKILQLGESLEQMGLHIKLMGPILEVSGEISDLPTFQKLKEIYKENKKQLVIKATISRNLKSLIFSDIYKQFLDLFIDSIECSTRYLNIECHYSHHISISIEKSLTKKFGISFRNIGIESKNHNYKLTFIIRKLEVAIGENTNVGLDNYQSNVENIIKKGLRSPILTNDVHLQSIKGRMLTVAEPSIVLVPGSEADISLGAEVPYDLGEDKGTGFKFAGLKIKSTILPRGKNFLCRFKVRLTRPSSSMKGGVKENQQSSNLVIPLSEKIQIFDINIENEGLDKKMIPVLSSIPVLGKLFSSSQNVKTTQRILAHVRVERL
ncbi:MAG: hypothetical protein KC493_06395 [Bacteriovoracaceae bacterium]|nr:hypothetical protein [Bacteriovoracaceae bacterium]